MHELPKELTKSLRSWRGSVYIDEPIDLEKQEGYDDKAFDEALSSTADSLIPHPKYSNRALDQARLAQSQQQPQSQDKGQQQQPSGSQQPQRQYDPQSRDHAPQTSSQNTVTVRKPPTRQPTIQPQTPASTLKKSIYDAPRFKDTDPAADRLDDDMTPLTQADFYELMGMKAPISKTEKPRELQTPHGLYGTILHRLAHVQNQYRAFDILAYAALILQLVISAVFIVLGSLTQLDSHIAIAVLGAVSTVIAGGLALMKGQGLPNRLRQTRDSLRNVKFEAEELYWDVGADREVFYKDIKRLREDYLRVMEEARKNHPDTWNVTASGVGKGIAPPVRAKNATLAQGAVPTT